MEFLVAAGLNPCGFRHVPCASVKQERRTDLRHRSNLNSWMSPSVSANDARLSVLPVKAVVRCSCVDSRCSVCCTGQTVSCLSNICSQPRNFFVSGEESLGLVERRSSQKLWQPVKFSNDGATKDLVCRFCCKPVYFNSGSSLGPSTKRSSQLAQHMRFCIENATSSEIVTRNRKMATPNDTRPSSGRGHRFSIKEGLSLETGGVRSSGPGLWLFHSLGQKRRSLFVCRTESGASESPSDMPAQSEESLGDEVSSSSSTVGGLVSYLKQVDWTNFVFGWQKDEPLWNVPWTGQTVLQVMVLWFAAFWVMGSWIIPIAAQLAGFSRHSLSFRGQALYSLITDIAEGTVGIWILRRCLARFLPFPEGWFPINLKGKWLFEACWGCLLFPLVNKLSQLNLVLLPLPTPLTTSYVEQSMMSRDPIATLLYAVVISVCAPVWEEVIFRGFLLPSMTRYLPLWGAISVSALAFALAHFSMQRILPLTLLGLVMGCVFVRSRNLLASIVLHSLWNGFAFLELL